jgi:hypothetical protein
VQSVASEAPPQFGTSPSLGRASLLAEIAWLLIVGGVILTIIGVIRYAQSGGGRVAGLAPVPIEHVVASVPGNYAGVAKSSVPVPAPAFCSSCGAGIVGEGRYCGSCGAPTAR